MTLRNFIHGSRSALSAVYPEGEARSIVALLCMDIAGFSPQEHILNPGLELAPEVEAELESAMDRLLAGEPLQYVTCVQEFCGRRFRISPAVLIPRPETEQLCRLAVEELSGSSHPRVLDLCTGSGCIAWTLALETGASTTAVDISPEALEIAGNQPFDAPVNFVPADLLSVLPESCNRDISAMAQVMEGSYDMILSNPPYVMDSEKARMRANVLEHEPHLALFVHDDDPLVFYRAIAIVSIRCLSGNGTGLVEINESLGPGTAKVFSDAGFNEVSIIQDFNGRDRFVKFRR